MLYNRSNAFTYYIYAEDEKAGSGIGKGLLSKALASLRILI